LTSRPSNARCHAGTLMPSSNTHKVMVAFALVYFFWGSTYLGIGIAVRDVPPEVMTGTRFLIAGVLMLAWCAWRGRKVKIGAGDALRLGTVGVLLLSVANVVLAYAEQVVPTGLAALIVSITPLWFLVIETWILRGDRLTARGMLGLPLGALGIAVLLWPQLRAGTAVGRRELWGSLSLLGGGLGARQALAGARGSVFRQRLGDGHCGRGEPEHGRAAGRICAGALDGAGDRSRDLPGGVRLMGGIQRVHMAAAERPHA